MFGLFRRDQFAPVKPWPKPALSACRFYHSFTFPNGEDVTGQWDLRACFDDYIGRYPLAGKTVLDFGTASGFLALSAEQRGATVTAFEAANPVDLSFIPFADSPFWTDRAAWARDFDTGSHRPRKQSYWYAWHSYASRNETIYAKIEDSWKWDRKFDVVIAAAIIEHLADPISAIGHLTRLAREALIIGFTPVDPTDQPMMRPAYDFATPATQRAWWLLSHGLYRRVLDNLGFDMTLSHCTATLNPATPLNDTSEPQLVTRPTIVARRR